MVLAEEQIDQWNRMQSPEIDPREYSQLIMTKSQGKLMEKGQAVLSTNDTEYSCTQKLKSRQGLNTFTKINSKWTKM